MENSLTWLLIADASKARIFSMHKARILQEPKFQYLELIGGFSHADSRKKDSELVSDKMGEYGSSSFAEPTSPKFHEAERFAHELITHLETGRIAKSFRDIILVAPPTFMGLLHKHMPHGLQPLVCQNIEKDYTQYNGNDLVKHLIANF